MTILSQEHIATTEEYQFKVQSEDWDEYTYNATVCTQYYPFEDCSINVEIGNSANLPIDHDEIVEKIEQSLSTMY